MPSEAYKAVAGTPPEERPNQGTQAASVKIVAPADNANQGVQSRSLVGHRPRANNLPLPLTSFVGQTAALATARRLVTRNRLLTLTGPGGVGKTRLALETAFGLIDQFEGGGCWVDLAGLSDPAFVVQAVCLALGLPDDPGRSPAAVLVEYVQDKEMLLVLDGCEHLVAASAELAGQLLASAPRLHMVVTSREMLGLAGERVWPVPPLSVPCLEADLTLESVTESDAGRLFIERARAVRPELSLTKPAVWAIAQVCCRLDGIPLAIELAAARARVLSLPEIAVNLDDRFRLLTGGSRTALPRHQTIRAAIEWSYDLLTPQERKAFARLAVFTDFGLAAAEAVVSDPAGPEAILPADVLDLLSHLVAKSLVVMRQDGLARFRMLETIRQYAWERLLASGELERVRHRHLAYYLELAEQTEAKLLDADQVDWLRLLEAEHDNLRAALAWSQESEARDAGLRLASALAPFWQRVGSLSEGLAWLNRTLAGCRQVGPARVNALYRAGRLAQQAGDFTQALAYARQSLALSRRLRDLPGRARALGLIGWIAHWQGDRDRAGVVLEEGLALARDSGDERALARALLWLGDLRCREGAYERSATLLKKSLALFQRLGDGWNMAWAYLALGEESRLRGNYRQAAAYCQLGLSFYQKLDSKADIPYSLEALALVAVAQGQFQRAACLWGAASALRDAVHALLPPSYEADRAPTMEKARTALGKKAFAAHWAQGRVLTLEEAIALAGESASPAEPDFPQVLPVTSVPRSDTGARRHEYGLTPREVEVVRMVASGLTDAQIAARLVISPRTVGKHLQSIYDKLQLPSRSAATRWAIEHRLA
jgi:predicted ATPase/DNA-binding CsgD family transcriptional regulator